MSTELQATLDISDVQEGFRGMIRATERSKFFFLELKTTARKELRDHQKEARGPNGEAWPARAPSTQERAQRGGRKRQKGPRARLLARLPTAWKATASNTGLLMEHHVAWSGVHDQGGVAGNNARMPRRQFAYLGRDFLEDAAEEYARFVLREYAGGRS